LQECKNAIDWSKAVVKDWLETGMFVGERGAASKAGKIVKALSDYDTMKNHSRHVHIDKCKALSLRIVDLESDQTLQDLVLTVHHAFMLTMSEAAQVTKIVENHQGIAMVSNHVIR
jgi:hypothetical protein